MKKIALAISLFLSSPLAQAAAADLPQQIQGGKSYSDDVMPDAKPSDAGLIDKTKSASLKYVDNCDQEITPKISPIDLGPSLPNSKIILLPDSVCYGNAGDMVVILDGNDRTLLRVTGGGVVVLSSQTAGVNNISIIEPGFSAPVWHWIPDAHSFQHYMDVPLQ
ncbi:MULTISPECIES: hypothetical protein [Acetobacter]|uniref:Uncharacterized protein n=1 Tax=Acetobacter oryzoeni TaxID=2500548 RepID=A0A5B9GJL4_9PROT|nr:hypothetical protein [Acetobacter oryzoeni]MCP1202247.1 hypothetical protein [Acetobacter oryzoeni]QEE85977.1 hypothetical protein EOV40_009840 [Acetobacter oryzoeni]